VSDSKGIRVVVADDSPSARELLVALLQNSGFQVVGVASNGEEAVRLTKRLRPDVVTMDIVMPKIDGLAATRRIMREVPTPIVVITASLMRADVDLTFEALQAGALTVVRKPGLNDPETCERVIQTVRLMSEVPVIHHWGRRERKEALRPEVPAPSQASLKSRLTDRVRKHRKVQIIGIASSTGGPATLAKVLRSLPAGFSVPILGVQHITRGFASGLADWLSGEMDLRVAIAGHGDTPRPGHFLLAPDDYHLQVNAWGVIELNREPPYKGLRPSANYLFYSLARNYGPRAVGIVLSGMGDDGAEGLEALHAAGGLVLAQNEQSCVVYGMPREVVVRNAADMVLSPEEIGSALSHLDTRVHAHQEQAHG
jgi:two-component system chemotaxis response regulator CheB